MADQLGNGMKFRTLTIVDVFSKEALAIEVGAVCRRASFEKNIALMGILCCSKKPKDILMWTPLCKPAQRNSSPISRR